MDSIIYDLFFGESDPLNMPLLQQEQYQEAVTTFDCAERALHESLDKEQRRLLLRMVDHHAIALSIVREDAFVRGFRLGGRLVAEVLG